MAKRTTEKASKTAKAETARTFWESFDNARQGKGRRLVREWLVDGQAVRFEVVTAQVQPRAGR